MKIVKSKKCDIDIETLKFWKHSSAKSHLEWLQAALEFNNAIKKGRFVKK